MLLPTTPEPLLGQFKPREKSDAVLHGCAILCALGDDKLSSKIATLRRIRGAFTHLLVLADVPTSDVVGADGGPSVFDARWPYHRCHQTRSRTSLSPLAEHNIELLGSLGFELHLALFNATALECGLGDYLGALATANVASLPVSGVYRNQLQHELRFVSQMMATPTSRHITGILPCLGGADAAAGDFTLRIVDELRRCGYEGSILHNLGGDARTLFSPKLRRAGVLSVCDVSNEGEWLRTACDIRSAIGLSVHPTQTVETVNKLCAHPGAVGYYMDFGPTVEADLPPYSVLVAAGAVPLPVAEMQTPTESPAVSDPADDRPLLPADPETARTLWKPCMDASLPVGSDTALLRLADKVTAAADFVGLSKCVLRAAGGVVASTAVQHAVYAGSPVVVYRFTDPIPAGPAVLSVFRSDWSLLSFYVRDTAQREYVRNIAPSTYLEDLCATVPAPAPSAPAVPAPVFTPVVAGAVENLAAGSLTIPTSWYTRRPVTVSYVYNINGAKRISIPAREVTPGVFDLGTPISRISHPIGTQPNVWILKFEPQTVVDTAVPVHQVGNYWYVYVENGKLRDR